MVDYGSVVDRRPNLFGSSGFLFRYRLRIDRICLP